MNGHDASGERLQQEKRNSGTESVESSGFPFLEKRFQKFCMANVETPANDVVITKDLKDDYLFLDDEEAEEDYHSDENDFYIEEPGSNLEFGDNDETSGYLLSRDDDHLLDPDLPADTYIESGLEVIQEETASQMSSDEETDLRQLDSVDAKRNHVSFADDLNSRKNSNDSTKDLYFPSDPMEEQSNLKYHYDSDSNGSEIVTKHIRILIDWNPEPLLRRLYSVSHIQSSQSKIMEKVIADQCSIFAGKLGVLSGNRRKGTFWNAWKKKYFRINNGRLLGFDNEDSASSYIAINLADVEVDYLDPEEFVSKNEQDAMVKRILGVDDKQGNYIVLQCASASEAAKWKDAISAGSRMSIAYILPGFSSPMLSLHRKILLVDIGSTNIRAGVLTNEPMLPSYFMPAVVSENLTTGEKLIGRDVYIPENRKNVKISFPFSCSSKLCQNVIDSKAVDMFLKDACQHLKIVPGGYSCCLVLPRKLDVTSRTKLMRLLFDDFKFEKVLLCHQTVAAFWSYNVDSGIMVDVGERCDIIPVSQGYMLTQAWMSCPMLGAMPMKHMLRQKLGPQENGLYLSTPVENLVLRFICENFTFIGSSNNVSRKSSTEGQDVVIEMDLRDVLSISSLIGVSQAILKCVGEGFFNPDYWGLDCKSLQKLLFGCVQKCEIDIRKEMSQNILLCGGCTLIPGFAERLQNELSKLCPPHLIPKIHVSPYRYHGSFIGASKLSMQDAFDKSLCERKTYEGGPGPQYWLV